MKQYFCILLFILSFITACNSTGENNTKVEFKLAETEISNNLTEVIYNPTGEKYYLHSKILLNENDISDAYTEVINNYPAIHMLLNDTGKLKLTEITANNIGSRIAFVINGKFISAPIIRDTINTGKVLISGDLTYEEAKKYVSRLGKE